MGNGLPVRLGMALVLAATAACSDDDDPTGPVVGLEQLVARCSRGTIDDATTTERLSGTIDRDDCRVQGDEFGGRLEGYILPQSAFGEMTTVQIDVMAAFDASIVVLDTEGNVLGEVDDTFTGPEQALLDFDALPSEPDYFIVVYSYDGDDSGSYTLDVGPVDEP